MERGVEFERQVVAMLASRHPLLRIVPAVGDRSAQDKADRETATVAAMRAGTRLIAAGRLPVDEIGRRTGEPDLLVAAGQPAPGQTVPGQTEPGRTAPGPTATGYRPVDVKHHASLRPMPASAAPAGEVPAPGLPAGGLPAGGLAVRGLAARGLAARGLAAGGLAALCSTLDEPFRESACAADATVARKRYDDLLQLAHYQRMLEAAGLAASDGRYGGIIGSECVVTWFDLDAPIWQVTSASGRRERQSTMMVYDREFDFRLDIIAVAGLRARQPETSLLVAPVRSSECDECPWWSWCGPELARGSGDVSLVPRVGWHAWTVHQDHGVTDRAALAALDHRTATLVAAGVDLRPVLTAIEILPGSTPVAEVVGERKRSQVTALAQAGITTLADAGVLDRATAGYSGAPLRDLPEQIDQARAALGGCDAYRRRGIGTVRVPRGDVEVDIDMENCEDGVYLWGTLVTDRSGRGLAEPGYQAFSTWAPMSGPAEKAVFAEFWGWLTGLRGAVRSAGLSFRAYCFHAAAENGQLRRIGAQLGREAEVAEFIASGEWIDLLKVFGSQLITGGPIGLKDIAELAGYRWTVQDPGGATAVVRYDVAVGPDESAGAARQWLLDYNRCDVEATRALRDWLDGRASDCPAVADISAR